MFNFFQLLGLPEQYPLEEASLEQRYFAAQRQFHPDRMIKASAAERATALDRSQTINDAYDTLKDPLSRAEHLLALKGYAVEMDGVGTVASPLLMEVMELHERIQESADDGPTLLAVVSDVKATARMCSKAIEDAFADEDYARAVTETRYMSYLIKALEEAHTHLYRFKAMHQKR